MESHSVCGVVYMSMPVQLLLTHVYVCVTECMQVWEDIAIKEESETGTTVESTIQLPTQVLCNASVSCCVSYSLPTSCGRPVHSIVDLLAIVHRLDSKAWKQCGQHVMNTLYMHFLICVCSWCIPLTAVHLLPVILPHFGIQKCYKQLVNSSMVNKLCMCRVVWLLSWHMYSTCALSL